jgi:ribosomal protein L32
MELKDKVSEFKSNAEKFVKGAVDGSKKMMERVRIKNEISKAESKLNAAYIEIGKKYEEIYGNRGEGEFAELLAQIAQSKASIAVSRAELAAVDSAAVCDNCGKYVQEGQRFCPHCGFKQEKPEEAEVVEAEACEAPSEETPAVDESAEA